MTLEFIATTTRVPSRQLLWLWCWVLTSQVSCKSAEGAPTAPIPEPSLAAIAGPCVVERFELWSTSLPVPPAVSLLYDAAANGYVATLLITANSRVSGSYTLSAVSRDPLRLGDVGGGLVTLVAPDTLLFSGASSLAGKTTFAITGGLLSLVNLNPRTVSLPPGPYEVTSRIACRL